QVCALAGTAVATNASAKHAGAKHVGAKHGADIRRHGDLLCRLGETLVNAAPAGNVPPMGHRAPTAKASLRLRDVTWTPQPADIRDAAARRMHFWLGRASEGRCKIPTPERKIR